MYYIDNTFYCFLFSGILVYIKIPFLYILPLILGLYRLYIINRLMNDNLFMINTLQEIYSINQEKLQSKEQEWNRLETSYEKLKFINKMDFY